MRPIGREGETTSASGTNSTLRPRARMAAQKSTSSAYMKYRSSSRPTASASDRRTSRQAPLTQSTARGRRVSRCDIVADDRRSTVVARARAASDAVPRKARSSSRTTAPRDHVRLPAADPPPPRPASTRGTSSKRRWHRDERSVSGFSSRYKVAGRLPDADIVGARRSRHCPAHRSRARAGHRWRTMLGRAVRRGVVDDDRLVVEQAAASSPSTGGTRRSDDSSCRSR